MFLMEHEISKEKSSAISLVRILATASIVVCHYLQAYHDKWAWVLNVGVQVFLVLSGYLYGHKNVAHWGKWFFNRFVKLYVPLYIFSTIVLLLIKYYTTIPVGIINFIKTGGGRWIRASVVYESHYGMLYGHSYLAIPSTIFKCCIYI